MKRSHALGSLFFAGFFVSTTCVQAQCQRGGQASANSTATTATTASVPYNLSALTNGYNQNSLGPLGYSQQPLATMMAMEQYHRNLRMATALQIQSQSLATQSQVAQVQALRKQMAKAGLERTQATLKDRAEALAMREEREALRKAKKYETQRSGTRLASIQ